MKRKFEETMLAKKREERFVELPLSQINLFDKYLDSFKKEKPHVVSEMKEWLTTLQHTYKSPTIECSYFFEIECKHTGLGGKDMPLIVFPV